MAKQLVERQEPREPSCLGAEVLSYIQKKNGVPTMSDEQVQAFIDKLVAQIHVLNRIEDGKPV